MTELARRRMLGFLAAAVIGVPLTACAPDGPGLAGGFSTGQGGAADSGHIALRNIIVVSAGAGTGTLLATIFNGGSVDDALLNVAVDKGEATLVPATIPIPAGGVAVIGMNTSLTDELSTVVLRGSPVKAGYFVRPTFTFARAAPIEVGALVVAHEGPYDKVPLPSEFVDRL
jgi:hypothetical protein